ncbi:MAG: site-specific integrase [Planctomycetes bacterium]|nr:site-specific integrase [Planctomycetota bacterium]
MAYRKTDRPGVRLKKNRHGTYTAVWEDPNTGKTISRSLKKEGFNTKSAAGPWLKMKSAELAEEARRVALRGPLSGVGETWQTIEASYKDHFEAEHGEDAAQRNDRDWLKRWKAHRAGHKIRQGGDLEAKHLDLFRTSLASGLASSTRNRHLSATRAMLNWARRNGYLRLNSDQIKDNLAPYRVPRRLPRVLNSSEVKRLIAKVVRHDTVRYFASRRDKAAYDEGIPSATATTRYAPLAPFVIIALLTGMRPGEVLSLKWTDVDLERRELKVWGAKTARDRRIPLHDSPLLVQFLTALQSKSKSGEYVCGDWQTGPREIHARQWRRVIDAAGLKDAPAKVLRATCIAHIASASDDNEYMLGARFGHANKVSVAYYRQPLRGVRDRGETVEDWMGTRGILLAALRRLKFFPRVRRARRDNSSAA